MIITYLVKNNKVREIQLYGVGGKEMTDAAFTNDSMFDDIRIAFEQQVNVIECD